jgi:hypothetical protein
MPNRTNYSNELQLLEKELDLRSYPTCLSHAADGFRLRVLMIMIWTIINHLTQHFTIPFYFGFVLVEKILGHGSPG